MFLEEYAEATGKAVKSAIVSKVYKLIQEASPEGSFVTFEKGRWYECSERIAKEKIGASFRDFLHENYKSSAKSKQAKKISREMPTSKNASKEMPSVEPIATSQTQLTPPETKLVASDSSIYPCRFPDSALFPFPAETQLVSSNSDMFRPFPLETQLVASNSAMFPFPAFFDVDTKHGAAAPGRDAPGQATGPNSHWEAI